MTEDNIFICVDYDPIFCKKQCKLIESPFEDSTTGNCVESFGTVTWKKETD